MNLRHFLRADPGSCHKGEKRNSMTLDSLPTTIIWIIFFLPLAAGVMAAIVVSVVNFQVWLNEKRRGKLLKLMIRSETMKNKLIMEGVINES
jgi:phosphate/sulfate permease